MPGKKSKNKGNNGERELAKLLSDTFNDTFIKAPSSGSYIGGKNASRKEFLHESTIRVMKGDIVPPEYMIKMVLEAKSYEDFPFHHLMYNKKVNQLDNENDGWIKQIKETIDKDDIWFICFKIKRKGWFVCFPKEYIDNFILDNYCDRKEYIVTELTNFFENNKLNIISLCSEQKG